MYLGDIEDDDDMVKRQWGLYRMNLLKVKQLMRLRLKQDNILIQKKESNKIDEIRQKMREA